MVQYVPDDTGRFSRRPHYKPGELDRECESIISAFLRKRYGDVKFPVATDDLTRLIEQDTEDLDVYADLSEFGPDVEGVTEFRPGRKPSVKISEKLTNNEHQENRLRTTLTHEYGHVRFHGYLWEIEPPQRDLLKKNPHANKQICKRDGILTARQYDWMEWQAGYICGAILMPVSHLRRVVVSYQEKNRVFGAVQESSVHGLKLVEEIKKNFQVSGDAARMRLTKLGILSDVAPTRSLFSA
jgi:hypothetical protein